MVLKSSKRKPRTISKSVKYLGTVQEQVSKWLDKHRGEICQVTQSDKAIVIVVTGKMASPTYSLPKVAKNKK